MGQAFRKLFDKFFGPVEMRVAMLGLDAAGKTTILYKLHIGEVLSTVPTIGFNVEKVQYKNVVFTVWDVGGQEKLRPLWRHYFSNTDALKGAKSPMEVAEGLGLYDLRNRTWHAQGTSAGTGDGLYGHRRGAGLVSDSFERVANPRATSNLTTQFSALYTESLRWPDTESNLYSFSLFNAFGSAGRTEEASILFNKMKGAGIQPGRVSYNTMINVYSTSGLYYEAKNLFQEMQKVGHSPDSLTYLALVRVCAESKNYSEAEETIQMMLEEGVTLSCAHFNHLIFAFINEGLVLEAEKMITEMKLSGLNPDLACCRTMMRAYMDYGLIEQGLSFYETTKEFLKPDGFILSAAAHLCDFAGKESEVGNLLDAMNLHKLVFLRNLSVGSKSQA